MATYIYVRNVRRAFFARKLARRLGIACVDSNIGPAHIDRAGHGLICWGNSTEPEWRRPRSYFWMVNRPDHVYIAAHKTRAFYALTAAGVSTLEYTTSREVASDWLHNGTSVYARTVVQGHSGDGLIFLDSQNNTDADVIQAPLYTKDFGTPFKEYRVHVVFGNVVDITQKKRLCEEETLARNLVLPAHRERLQVRTYGNGWVFTRQHIKDHERIRTLAINAARAINNMDMAVVDIVAEWRGGEPIRLAVIEINTAPALRSPTLLNAYVDILHRRIYG